MIKMISSSTKLFFIILVTLLFFKTTFAQKLKKDTSVYYLKNSLKQVKFKDSADFILVILPPDTNIDKNLFVINEFYPSGKIKLIGNSKVNDLSLKFEGSLIEFFPNGHKMRVSHFENEKHSGNMVEYYPNGKLYNSRNFKSDQKPYLSECRDSTGTILAFNGKGKWVEYSNDFKSINSQGPVINGLQDGEWRGKINGVNYNLFYKKGTLLSSSTDAVNESYIIRLNKAPEFPGGLVSLAKFLIEKTHYPAEARKNNIKGRVIVSFVIEKDGTLTDVKVIKGLGFGCDEEAIRVIKLSSPWIQGLQNGESARFEYSVPVAFTESGKY